MRRTAVSAMGEVVVAAAFLLATSALVCPSAAAQSPGRNRTPRILNLTAVPSQLDQQTATCLVSFVVDDPDGDYVSWSIALASTGDSDLDEEGSLDNASGTDAPGTLVQVTYSAPQTWNNLTVVVKVSASDGKGGWAAPQWTTIWVAPGSLGRSP